MNRTRLSCVVLATLVLGSLVGRVEAQGKAKAAAPKKGGNALQGGETVLPLASAAADSPRRRGDGAPWIELTEFRKGARNKLVVDYSLAEGATSTFTLVVKSVKGRTEVSVTVGPEKKGEIEFASPGDDVEIWAEWGPPAGRGQAKPAAGSMKVSKSLTRGNVGQITLARVWTNDEEAAFKEFAKATAPPPPPPTGHEILTAKTEPLIPGMPVKVASRGEWEKGEYLGRTFGLGIVKWTAPGTNAPAIRTMPLTAIAISTATLKTGQDQPATFKPTETLFPGSAVPLPDNARFVTADVALVPGTPLVTASGKVLYDMDDPDGGIYVVSATGFHQRTKVDRNSVAILKSDLPRLKDADAVAGFEKAHTAVMEGIRKKESQTQKFFDDSKKQHEEFMVKVKAQQEAAKAEREKPPAGYVTVKGSVVIPKGAGVLFFDRFRWKSGLVTQPAKGDSVSVLEDGPGLGRETQVPRDKTFVQADLATDLEKGRGLDGVGNSKYELILESSSVFVVSVLTDALKMPHAEASELREVLVPTSVKSGLTLPQARAIQNRIAIAGGVASIKPVNGKAKAD